MNNSSHYFTSNTEFVFLPGVFILNGVISISHVDGLSLVGGGTGSHLVQCSHSIAAGITITNSSNIGIHSLAFLKCSHLIDNVDNNYTSAALAFRNATNLTVFGTTVNESAGIGLFIHEVFGSCNITNSMFANNTQFNNSFLSDYTSGNTFIVIKECPYNAPTQNNTHIYLHINSSSFLNGKPCYDCPSPGLYIRIETRECFTVNVSVTHSNFIGNNDSFSVQRGGNIGIDLICYTGFEDTLINISDNLIMQGTAYYGGGLHVNISTRQFKINKYSDQFDCGKLSACSYNLTVDRNHFIENTAGIEGGGFFITNNNNHKTLFDGAIRGRVSVSDCMFVGNNIKGKGYGAAAFINSFISFVKWKISSFVLAPNNCHFIDNGTPEAGSGALYVLEASNGVHITDCTFVNNKHTALMIVRSIVLFKGNITFQGNVGYDGGGISFCSRSYVYFQNNTFVQIRNNTALHSGGGIYVDSQCPSTKPGCFFQFLVNFQKIIVSKSIRVEMTDNKAHVAGSSIYGAYVDDCYVFGVRGTGYKSPDIFHNVFQVPSLSLQDMSPVSSTPSQVCFCNSTGLPNCRRKSRRHRVFPGQTIVVSAVAVGMGEGVVPGVVVATPKPNQKHLIKVEERLQSVGRNCSKLNYTLRRHTRKRLVVSLDIEKPERYEIGYSPSPKKLSITFKTCPIGFTLRHNPRYCDCIRSLENLNSRCGFIADKPFIQQQLGNWIGVINLTLAGNSSLVLLTYSKCLFHYCTFHDQLDVINLIFSRSNIINQDSQCVRNRAGTLCGSCKKGYSITNGAFECRDCSNTKLYVNIPIYLLAGVLFVVLLLFFNFTVTVGTINGLIFYANIVEYTILYFYAGPSSLAQKILANFVAILNLSYGSGFCLYNGTDAIIKVWLDYAFPLYVLLLTAAIITASRCSIRVSRLLGNNTPKVISTLLLLMYVKVIQTAIYGISHASLNYELEERKGTYKVWLYDGNIEFLKGKHTYLFAFSVFVISLSFPYTLCLLLIQPLRWYSHLRPLRWVQRLMPLFDAYTAPYKNKYHFWPGLLLLARNFLLVVFALNSGGDPVLSLSCVVLACSILQALAWSLGGVYRKWKLNALESFFFFNLTFISISMAFGIHSDQKRIIANTVGLSVFTSFFITIFLLMHHCYKQMKQNRPLTNCYYRFTQFVRQMLGQHQLPIDISQDTYPELLVSQRERERDYESLRAVDSERDELNEYSQLLSHTDVHSVQQPN